MGGVQLASSFVVSFDTDGSAFHPDPEPEIARILRAVATKVELGEQEGAVLDLNGNRIGRFELTAP